MSSHANRTAKTHVAAAYSWLGKGAVLGPLEVRRRVGADRFVQLLLAAETSEARHEILRAARDLEKKPRRVKAPNPNERVKVRWTEDPAVAGEGVVLISRFKREAVHCKDNVELARRLGLPAFCAGAMSAARSRYLPRVVATSRSRKNRPGESAVSDLLEAA
jgi:hypothetical protein